MSTIPTNLTEILDMAGKFSAQNLRTLAVFDLDSTLFNVSTRTQKILNEFAEIHQIENLKNAVVKPEDWGVKEAVLRAGLSLVKDTEILKLLRNYWSEKFFSNEYLHYDVPYLGAINFVNELLAQGCEINYLTGRDEKRMLSGTIEVLKKWGFPYNEKNLFLKPEKTVDDELYKYDWFKKLNSSHFEKIYFFENEPINVNAVLNIYPQLEIVFLDTTHARKQEPPNHIMKIKNFSRTYSC